MTWEKIGIWLKHFWYFPMIAILLVVVAVLVGTKDNIAMKLFQNAFNSYDKQIKALATLQKESDDKKKALEVQYQLLLQQIEKQYNTETASIQKEQKERAIELLDKYKDNQKGLAEAFSKEFGLTLGDK